MKTLLPCFFLAFGLTLLGNNVFAQPTLSYSPSADVLTLNTAFTLSPTSTGVAAFAYGTGVLLTGALNNPWDMAIDPSGNIYVTNYNSSNYAASSISKYNSAGVYQGTFGTTANLAQPSGICFDAFGNAYVLNYNRTNNGLGNDHGNGYVDQYNSSGVYQATIIQGLGSATGITMDASNNLYVAMGSYNSGFNTVSQYNTSGALAFSIAAGQTTNPVAVAVDGSYNIYVLDNTSQKVYKYNSSGAYVSTVVTGLSDPNAIYIDGAGDIYIGDSGTGGATGNTSGSVKVYSPSGALLTSITGLNDPRGLVTDSKGNLYVSDYTNNTVTKYPPVGGYFLSRTLPPGLSFSSTTGVFSGTPVTGFAATQYIVTAYNASGSVSFTETLSCLSSAPTITYDPYSISVYTTKSAITPDTAKTTGGPSSFSISAPLPAGLTFSTTTGIISGTPTVTSAATVYTVTATNGSLSGTTKISIACVNYVYWTGSKNSNDWSFGPNWSTNKVPGPTDVASIGVTNYKYSDPVITTADGAISVDYVTFGAANAATLTVQTGASLTVNNILTVNTNATPIFNGTGTGAINIATTAVVDVVGTGALTINSPLTFTLKSDATGSASIDQMTSGLIVGQVSVQRFITGGAGYRGYRLLSSPVYASKVSSNRVCSINYLIKSCYIKGTLGSIPGGFDAAGNPNLYLYRENLAPSNSSFTSGNFRGVNNISTAPTYGLDNESLTYNIPVGNGYLFFFRGDRSVATLAAESVTTYVPTSTILTATGTLNQGADTVKDWYTPASSNLGNTNTTSNNSIRGFNLIGNPYACSIDWDTYSTTSSTAGVYAPNLEKFIYVLDPKSQNYSVYAAGTGGIGTIATSQANIISSGHGFFVIASNSSAQLIFNEAAKTPLSQATTAIGNLFLGKPVQAAVNQRLHLRLTKDSLTSTNTDGLFISFNSSAKPQYVEGEDAMYKPGNGSVSLSSRSADSIALAINTLPLPKQDPLSIALNVNAYVNGIYQLDLDAMKGIPDLFDMWLMDAYKKDSVDIKHNPTYSFNVLMSDKASYGANRFSLVIRQNHVLGIHLLDFTANKAPGGVQIVWTTENEQNYTNFTVERSTDGGVTFSVLGGFPSGALGTYSFLDKYPPIAANQYRLKMEDLNGTITYSSIVTLMYANSTNSIAANNISVYPNPVTSTINLSIAQNSISASGSYKASDPPYAISIANSSGMIIKTASSSQTQWQDNLSNLLPGTYVIQVVNANDKTVVGKTKFIKL